jgi:hypothetical protein
MMKHIWIPMRHGVRPIRFPRVMTITRAIQEGGEDLTESSYTITSLIEKQEQKQE